MRRSRMYFGTAAGLAVVATAGTIVAGAATSSSSTTSSAPLPATHYGTLGGPDTANTARAAAVSDDQSFAVRGFYNSQGKLCVDMAARKVGVSLQGCANPESDGRQTPPTAVLPLPDGTIVAGLAPDDVPTVAVIDDQGTSHKASVTNNGWTVRLPAGRQVSRLDYEHANGRVEALPG
jgi:hypothetical protein